MHKLRNVATSVHGDDFTSVGPKVELDWLEAKLGSRYELRKGGRLGLGPRDSSLRLLPLAGPRATAAFGR